VKALIKVGYGCNDHCTFCHTLDVRHVEGEAAEVHAKIARARELGHAMVVLSGGEPTIRPELLRWADHVARLGMDFGLVTNGRMLRYPALVEQLLARRLRYVYLSLHGGSARVHDMMVRSDAFDETFAGLRNVSGRGLDLTVNCVVTRHNLRHLVELVDAVLPFHDAKLKLSMVEPKGGGDKLFEHLVPPIEEVAASVREALEHGRARTAERGASGPRLLHGGIPLCLLPGWEDAYDDLRTHGFRTMVEVGEPDFFPVDDLNKVQPEEVCGGCTLRGACPGLYRGYAEVFGAGALRPRREGVRGNSFDFVAERIVARALPATITHETCPVRALGVTPWDHARDLHVRHGPRLVRFRATGRDLADVEMSQARARGQLYVDVSRKPAPDDFARDLRKLARAPACTPCPDRPRCAGLYEVTDDDVFSRDDARIRARLRDVEGDVLDVGCGELRYATELDRPRVRYVGIDPDAARLETLRARFPRATARLGAAEEIEDEQAFDVVLVLHAWNHLARPPDVAARLARALRPGGVLLVADDVAFGLARSVPQARAARSAPLALEHHRLDDDVACAAVLRAAGLTIVGTIPVGPATSNQWIVEARRDP
jgi:MoaA/NifB/PqqE/SkfB family radical SAM enzyme/SAM-dependent methyltransferase